VTKRIPESYFKEYKSAVLQNSGTKDVKLSFLRPGVTIEVTVTAEVSESEIDQIFELTKSYVTVENMDRIAKHVDWDREIWEVRLRIINNTSKTVLEDWWTEYFKTSYANDYSPENIDGYKTWKNGW
jgi:hypothetical protein